MNHAVGVDVVESLCDANQLMEVEEKGRGAQRNTDKGNQILVRV